ncbi:hypothetical protein [Streptomyces sp. NBC_00358]|uniref:hypothetical protein n=1 Tax=Streptomyces sp. NBC_00358 TaxID=2975725 RepID=UPI002E2583AD
MNPESRTVHLLGPPARGRLKRAGVVASLALVMASGVVGSATPADRSASERAPAAPDGDRCRPAHHHRPQALPGEPGDHWNACRGPRGPRGETGATGPTGPQGPPGVTGEDGSPGTAGATGATGPTGEVGSPGLAGATGPQGATGAAGASGLTGPPGAPGPCLGIDAAQESEDFEIRVALTGGSTYAGIRDQRTGEKEDFLWTDLSGRPDYPAGGAAGLPCDVTVNAHNRTTAVKRIKFDVITTTGQIWEAACVAFTTTHPATLNCADRTGRPKPWILVSRQPTVASVNGGV